MGSTLRNFQSSSSLQRMCCSTPQFFVNPFSLPAVAPSPVTETLVHHYPYYLACFLTYKAVFFDTNYADVYSLFRFFVLLLSISLSLDRLVSYVKPARNQSVYRQCRSHPPHSVQASSLRTHKLTHSYLQLIALHLDTICYFSHFSLTTFLSPNFSSIAHFRNDHDQSSNSSSSFTLWPSQRTCWTIQYQPLYQQIDQQQLTRLSYYRSAQIIQTWLTLQKLVPAISRSCFLLYFSAYRRKHLLLFLSRIHHWLPTSSFIRWLLTACHDATPLTPAFTSFTPHTLHYVRIPLSCTHRPMADKSCFITFFYYPKIHFYPSYLSFDPLLHNHTPLSPTPLHSQSTHHLPSYSVKSSHNHHISNPHLPAASTHSIKYHPSLTPLNIF